MLVDTTNEHSNWLEALSLWNRIANWSHYRTSESQLRTQIKSLLVYLWNEKDWLKKQYPLKKNRIESFVDKSTHIAIVADLANTVKHCQLDRYPRSTAAQTNYFGRVTTGRGNTRKLYFISVGGSKHREIMEILRGSIEEFEQLRGLLRSGSL